MAKRAPTNEKPYSPVQDGLVSAVLRGGGGNTGEVSVPVALPAPNKDTASPHDKKVVELDPSPRKGRRGRDSTERQLEAPARPPIPTARLDREKRVLLSRSEEAAVGELVQRLSSAGATTVKLSHLLRACILILRHSETELVKRVKDSSDLVRPPNDNAPALAQFEHRLAQEVAAAIRAAPPLRE